MTGTAFNPQGLGWRRDMPDNRDLTCEHPSVIPLIKRLKKFAKSLPVRIDLRSDEDGEYLLQADDQGSRNNSSTHACLGLIEYFNRRCLGIADRGSALFVYEMTRRMTRSVPNGDVCIRSTFKTLKRFGAPPHWMCNDTLKGQDPLFDNGLMGFTKDLEDLLYFRVWTEGCKEEALHRVKRFLAAGFPVVFGFAVPNSLSLDQVIMCRPGYDSYFGGQAVLAVGYDDERLSSEGAILVRSSWGSQWGDNGFGWLPYSFIKENLAADFWSAVKPAWVSHMPDEPPSSNRPKIS